MSGSVQLALFPEEMLLGVNEKAGHRLHEIRGVFDERSGHLGGVPELQHARRRRVDEGPGDHRTHGGVDAGGFRLPDWL